MITPSDINFSELPSVPLKDRGSLPTTPCIYFAMSGGTVQYIGRSVNPKQRWVNHHRYGQLLSMEDVSIAYINCPDLLLEEVESALIEWFDPPLNGLIERRLYLDTPMKALRERVGISQESLARAIGKTVSAVSKWDQGRNFPALYPSEIAKLLSVLDCSLDELIEAEKNWRDAKDGVRN